MNKKVISNIFKVLTAVTFAIVTIVGLNTAFAAAGVPAKLSYQGRLTSPTGSPLPGPNWVCFSLWDSPTVGSGNKLWPPAANPTPTPITLSNGVFNTQVGLMDTLVGYDFASSSPEYLQVGVSGSASCAGAENLSPRQSIDATAYARVAENVWGDLLKTDDAHNLVQIGTGIGGFNPVTLVLDSKTNADAVDVPGGCGTWPYYNGSMWYNSASTTPRICAGNIIRNLMGSPAGVDTQIQFNNAGVFGGDADFTWNDTTKDLFLGGVDTGITLNGITNEPPIPAAGDLHIYAKSIAGRVMPKWVGPSGVDVPFQAFVGQDKIGWWNPSGNANGVPGVLGFNAPTPVGTATARNVATTRFFTRTRRLGYVTTTTTNQCAGHYNGTSGTQYTVGDGTGLGGFFYVARFGTSDAATVSGAREFVGMTSNTAAPNGATEPSTFTNSIGIGHGAADANLKLYYGGSSAQTPIDLGANFPKNTLSVDLYELVLFAPPNANNRVGYKVTRLNTGAVAEGTLNAATPGTQLPLSTTLLGHRAYRTNGSTGVAVGIDIASVYISSDQ